MMIDKIINNKYKILEKIGQGTFGCIYKAINTKTDQYVAIKLESIESELQLIKYETKVYQYLNTNSLKERQIPNDVGIPTIKWYGKDNDNYYLVMPLLGKTIHHAAPYSLEKVCTIGKKILSLIEFIHYKDIVHRDIKPDNFLFSINSIDSIDTDFEIIYIIDFGLCKIYKRDGIHIPEKTTKDIIGSITYASIHAHSCIELSCRDDIESFAYMLIYLYLGNLPWQKETNREKLILWKTHIESLNKKLNNIIPETFLKIIQYSRTLKFEDRVDYKFINSLLSC
jgi:serine/threonine protein kinase